MNIFPSITQGDSATWADDPFSDTQGGAYDSASYSLRYEIRGTGAPLTLNSTPLGSGWSTAISTAQSAALPVGTSYWSAYASKAGVRVTAGTGTFIVVADMTTQIAGYDGRRQAQRRLEAVQAEMDARLTGSLAIEYTIGNRSLRKEPMSVLIALEARYIRQVKVESAKEQRQNGQGHPRRILARFTGTS